MMDRIDPASAGAGRRPVSADGRHGRGYVLPLLKTPFTDESLPGLIMRTAEPFRFRDATRLFRLLELQELGLWELCRLRPGTAPCTAVRTCLGLDESSFERLNLWSADASACSVSSVPVWTALLRCQQRAVCPLCLREAPYHRVAWLVAALPVCLVHGVWLNDRCHDRHCRRALTWQGVGVHRCSTERCRKDLRSAPCVEAVLDPDQQRSIAALHELIVTGNRGSALPTAPSGEIFKMAYLLGTAAVGGSGKPSGQSQEALRRMPEIMASGWKALEDWPRGFHSFLDRIVASEPGMRGPQDFERAYGHVIPLIHQWSAQPWGGSVRKAFVQHAAARLGVRQSAPLILRHLPQPATKKP